MRPLDTSAVVAFTEELQQSLPVIDAALAATARDRANAAATHEAYRLIHALKGAASMVGLAALGWLFHRAEAHLEEPLTGPTPAVADAVLAQLRASVPQFAAYMDAALAGRPLAPLAHALADTLGADAADRRSLDPLIAMDTRELASWLPETPAAEAPLPAADGDPEPADAITPEAPDDRPANAADRDRESADVCAQHAPDHPQTIAPPLAPAITADGDRGPADGVAQDAPDHQPPIAPAAAPAAVGDLDLVPAEALAPELAEVFAQEAQDHLQTIARGTTQLATAPDDREGLQELRRAVHTLKGAAGVVGYQAAARLAHRMEDLLDRLYDGTAVLTPAAGQLLAASSDTLDDLLNRAGDAAARRAALARLFAAFDALMGPAPAAAPPRTSDGDARASDGAPAVPDRRRRGSDRRRGDDRRGPDQVLRVPVPRLNELVRAVSELVLNRSTFEQHYAALLAQVDELQFSAARIRRVAQKLEADYEVRALAGHHAPAARGGHGFDELEFDRYTDFHLLTRELTETASDVTTASARVSDGIGDFDGDLTRLGRLTREIQDKTLEFRMVPLGTVTARLERAVRVTAEACGRLVDFALEGEPVALDKALLDRMADPLLHLLRNAVDHGIEPPDVRRAAGKAPRGRVTVRASHDGSDVVLEVTDDGAGLDVARLRRAVVEKGFLSEGDAAALAPEALFAYIFEPGFSTAAQVSEVSGRGVGLDVVRATVVRLGGRVQIASQPGAGTTLSVRVPMTLAITRVLLVRAGGETFGLPLSAVIQIVRPPATALGHIGAERVLTLDGQTYPLRDLADTLGLPRAADAPAAPPVLIANLAGRRIALALDAVLHSRDAVVKSLGTHLRRVPGVWGATLLGDGTVVLILNTADLAGAADDPRPRVVARPAVPLALQPYTILIVDDSLSMRHVLSTAVTKAGWQPLQARDGLEALGLVQRAPRPPDLILLDIEMPRMDGYEFLATIRGQAAYADLPIVMLTSRGSDKHRDKATALGATDYLVKPFREDALVATIDRLVQAARRPGRRGPP